MNSSFFTAGKQRFTALLRKKWVTPLFSGVLILLTLSLLGYLIYRERATLLTYPWQINPLAVAGALAAHGVAMFFGILTWADILNTLGPKVGFKQHARAFCLNMLARRVPGTLWYVIYRVQAYNQFGFSAQITSLASGVELAVGIASGGIVTLLFAFQLFGQLHLSPWLILILLALCAAFLNPRFLNWVIVKSAKSPVQLGYRSLLKWVALYILIWAFSGVSLFCIVNIFTPLSVQYVGYITGSWALVGVVTSAAVFLPSNFGFTEISFSLLLAQLIPYAVAVVIAVSTRIILILFELFWALISLFFLK